MKYIAHRGIHNNKKDENTYNAFKNIQESIFCGYEADVRVTKDNEFIIYHDPLYKGRLIRNVYYNEINALTLDKLLGINTSKIVLLEIKDFNINIKKFLNILKKYNLNIYIMSFSNDVIEKIYKENVSYKLGVLNYVFNSSVNYKYDFICLVNSLLNDFIINYYNKKNVKIICYGINNIKDIKYNYLTYIIDSKKI